MPTTHGIPASQANEEMLAAIAELDFLGIPPSRRGVHQGLHPFTPERTLILDGPSKAIPDLMAVLMKRISRAYQVMDREAAWTRHLLLQVSDLYPCCLRAGIFISPLGVQQQGESIATRNGIVDWWLALVPQGCHAASADEIPLHLLMLPIFTQPGVPQPPVRFWNVMAKSLQPKLDAHDLVTSSRWAQLSRTNRREACFTLNQHVVEFLNSQIAKHASPNKD